MRFNTSSKSGKNGNSKHGRIPLLIYYYSALWEVSVKYTSGQLKLQWSCLTCSHMENHLFSELISFSYPKCLSISSTIAKRRKKYVLDMRIYVEYTLKRWAQGSKKQGSKKNYKKKKKRKKKQNTTKTSWWSKAKNPVTLQVYEASEISGSLLWCHLMPVYQKSPRTHLQI